MSMILEEIYQVQNAFSLMDGNSYLSLQKKQKNNNKNTPRSEHYLYHKSNIFVEINK